MSPPPASTPTLTPEIAEPRLYLDAVPHERFAEIRAMPGLAWHPYGDNGFWAVTRHADVRAVSRNPAAFSSAIGHTNLWDLEADALEARRSLIDTDAPDHTRLRRMVAGAFTPKNIRRWEEAVREITVELLDELTDHLVAGTSSKPLEPTAYGNTIDLRLLPFNSPAAYGINEYARALRERRRAEPADDLVTKLIEAEVDGERLTDAEFTNFFRLMVFAGNETTRASMAHLALHLVEFADQFEILRSDPSLMAQAAEEVIRYSSPILYFRRTVTRDTVLQDIALSAGDKVVMWYAAANFDETTFDDPMRFDVSRPLRPPNVAFGGGGAHFCLGAPLARLELAVLIEAILQRGIELELDGEPVYVDSNFVNGIEHLGVKVRERGRAA
jgi:cholest-4-en-3-one 26-monooxygenase